MKNSKSIYEILNDIDVNIEDYEKEGLNDMEKENLKRTFRKNIRRKFNFKRFASIAVALILTIGVLGQTNLGRQVYAAAESKISEISYSIGKALGIERDIESFANVINQVVEDKGITVKLTNAIVDKGELILTAVIDTSKPLDAPDFGCYVFIDGKRVANMGYSSSVRQLDDSETLFSVVYNAKIKDIPLKENIDMKVVFDDLYYFEGSSEKKIKGRWEFEFVANGEELAENTYIKSLDYSFNIDNQTFILEEFRYNPVNQKISGKIDGESNGSYQIELKGHDNLENEVIFYMGRLSRNKEGGIVEFRYENIHGDLSDEITSIKLTPYAAKFPEESGRMNAKYEKVGEEFTIYLNE